MPTTDDDFEHVGKHKKRKSKSKEYSNKEYSDSSSENEWVESDLVNDKHSSKRITHSSQESSVKPISKEQKNIKNSHDSKSKSNHFGDYQTKKKSKNKNSDDESSPEEVTKRKSKMKSKRKYSSSSMSSDEDNAKRSSYSENCRLNKYASDNRKNSDETPSVDKREDWMGISTLFSSFSNHDRKHQREQEKKHKKELEQYNPSKYAKELNPYWKNGGDGLPKFQKPKEDYSDNDSVRYTKSSARPHSGWRKSDKSKHVIANENEASTSELKKSPKNELSQNKVSEKELNVLAGKLVKAEIMGNEKLIKELKEQLENARRYHDETKSQEKDILLTETSHLGHSRPLIQQRESKESTASNRKRKKAVETHKNNERVKYFANDDKYSLKQMFENEKFNSSNEQNREFMSIASKIRKNDDLDDLFTDSVRRKKSDSSIDDANRSKAINEHNRVSDRLDNCSKCIQSDNMQKHLMITMGEYTYLSVPPYEPLLEGHCFIIPIRHVQSVTQLDENEWTEILDFRKTLVRLFGSKEKEPIFFETAAGFHRYPHMVLECVPMPKAEGEMAPIYFKKAIDESETEWSQNKKLVSLKGRDVRRAIPKGLPYFSVSFGMDEGFAHVIEDERLFPKNFAQEVIAGILDLHHSKWRKLTHETFDVQSRRVSNFSKDWMSCVS